MGRIATIADPIALAKQSLSRFPQNRAEIQKGLEYYDKLNEAKQYRLSNELTRNKQINIDDMSTVPVMLEPGVTYTQKWLGNKTNSYVRKDGLPYGGFVDFLGTSKVPMGDWDFPDAHHPESSISISNLGDVYDSLIKNTTDNPNSLWQVYLTPGGVRAFQMGEQATPKEYMQKGYLKSVIKSDNSLNMDRNYANMAVKQTNPTRIPKYDLLYPKQAWNARISSKPGRNEDFVAYPIGNVGNGIVDPYNRRIIDSYHDLPIMQSLANDGMSPGVLPKSGLDLLEWHLASVPKNYRDGIERGLQAKGLI
jgi:hypothetical protein